MNNRGQFVILVNTVNELDFKSEHLQKFVFDPNNGNKLVAMWELLSRQRIYLRHLLWILEPTIENQDAAERQVPS